MTTPCINSARSRAWIGLSDLLSLELLSKFKVLVGVIGDLIMALFVL